MKKVTQAVVFGAMLAAGTAPVLADADKNQVRVAQIETEVYFGPRGEVIHVDPYTGEVVAIEPPRRNWRRSGVRREHSRPSGNGFNSIPLERQRRAYPGQEDYYPDYDDDSGRIIRDPLPRKSVNKPEHREVRRQELDQRSTGTVSKQPEVTPEKKIPASVKASRMLVAKVQILLDRAGASPGVIDGLNGSNMRNALAAWQAMTGSALDMADEAAIDSRLAVRGGDAFVTYTITNSDAAGPYVASIPSDYGQKAQLERMSYTSASEAIAEKFHMDESFLAWLNPGVNFSRPGTVIKVANPGMRVLRDVTRIEADKGREQVRAYDANGQLVAVYPATIGSSDTPSPSGTVNVERIAFNPEYTYNPKKNFKQGDNDKILRIPPGPNGPVGSIWIALSKPTYGIHGTPNPDKIGKTNSHGCVRLTNWDAEELARLVKPGVSVTFID